MPDSVSNAVLTLLIAAATSLLVSIVFSLAACGSVRDREERARLIGASGATIIIALLAAGAAGCVVLFWGAVA